MTIFQAIILTLLVASQVTQWLISLEHKCFIWSIIFGFEIVAFIYLSNIL